VQGVSSPREFLDALNSFLGEPGTELLGLVAGAVASVERGESTAQYAESLGLERGVTGYTNHTVPVCLHAWLAHPRDFTAAITTVILCGGDADTTAAIVGGVVGAGVGREGIPEPWLRSLWEWPRSVAWMQRLGAQLAETVRTGTAGRPIRASGPALLARNLLFLAVVLCHGFRRLAPPY
jgi:ADP-ribosyl-[dinitrogen reductase] hydrolase